MPQGCIHGTGSSTPARILSNEDLQKIVDTSDEWITRRTGIKERRIASTENQESSVDLGLRASLKALEMAQQDPDSLDMIVVGTVTPDRQFPSVACLVQKELQAARAFAFDLSAGCSGFLYALTMVDNAIRTGMARTALVIGVERLSSIANWRDRSTCVLLGDGAGAVVVGAGDESQGILSSHLKADGNYWDLLYSLDGNFEIPESLQGTDVKPFHLKMEGNRLFKRAVGCMADVAREALAANSIKTADIDMVIPHQANIRIIQALAENLQIPMEKVYTNLHKYGNTSSASIPIALDEANRKGRLHRGDHVLLVSFGAGLTWGAAIVKWTL